MMRLRLFPVIAFAVALLATSSAWLMYRVWQSNQPVDDVEAEQMSRQGELNLQQMQEQLSGQVAGTLGSEQQDRMDSPLGLAIFRKCVEWTEFNESHASEMTLQHQESACSEFREYVRTGEIPPQQ